MRGPIVGGGTKKVLYALRTLQRVGLVNGAKFLRSRNTCTNTLTVPASGGPLMSFFGRFGSPHSGRLPIALMVSPDVLLVLMLETSPPPGT